MIKWDDLKNWAGNWNGNWGSYWEQLRTVLLDPKVDEALLEKSLQEAREKMPVPVLWMIGKTQAGKTSIIRAMTGSESAEIGNGFQPCTRQSQFYDFPADTPVVRFLDTRGLGEVAYDPTDDIEYCESKAHLLIAVMKVADIKQQALFYVLRMVRERHPEWPVLIVQTGLHECYPPGRQHVQPWPYDQHPLPNSVPSDLKRALLAQREAAQDLPGDAPVRWVAVDLTLPEDGFDPADYGLEALWQTIEELSSLGLENLLTSGDAVQDLFERTAHQHIVGYSTTAAGLGALPVVDLVSVTAVQAKLLHSLAVLYGQSWDKRTTAEFLGLLGVGMATSYLARWVGRTVAKVIPVVGQTFGALWGASASGAATYALGKAAVYFFVQHRNHLNVDAKTIRQIYAEEFERGAAMLKNRLQGKAE